ncbi:MAG: peptidase [Planctomycetes bacterium SCN 63-9]|nr:MAG: peptidase [Planctomycetes bacterium SCN 63-9]
MSLRRKLVLKFAAFMRWLHIYLSMLGLGTLLFFSLTGITLNHPDWFSSGPETTTESRGRMLPDWLQGEPPPESAPVDRAEGAASRTVDKLKIVEYLRGAHGVRGALADFQIDEQECVVSFKGAGYAADAFIERESGEYRITETQHSLVSMLNDLHKGRDTGRAWSWVIDVSAGMLSLSSLSGMILLLYIKRRRRLGILTGILGALVLTAIAYYFVP